MPSIDPSPTSRQDKGEFEASSDVLKAEVHESINATFDKPKQIASLPAKASPANKAPPANEAPSIKRPRVNALPAKAAPYTVLRKDDKVVIEVRD